VDLLRRFSSQVYYSCPWQKKTTIYLAVSNNKLTRPPPFKLSRAKELERQRWAPYDEAIREEDDPYRFMRDSP